MKTTVYHCSPTKILKFNCERGVHVGGKRSAMQAGQRKSMQDLTMHVCELNLTNLKLYDTFDKGGDEDWQREIRFAKEDGYKVIRYKNEYEPDTEYSYIVLDDDLLTIKNSYGVSPCDPSYFW